MATSFKSVLYFLSYTVVIRLNIQFTEIQIYIKQTLSFSYDGKENF